MRCKNIAVNFSIPVRINKPDGNGNVYTESAVINACKNAETCPIVQYNSEGKEVVIGVANKVKYSEGFILVEGVVWYGGTGETIPEDGKTLLDKGVKISNMNITHFGLCE